jgi:hypothetical protein
MTPLSQPPVTAQREACLSTRLPTAPKGNGTRPSHRHVPNWTVSTQRDQKG